MSIFPSKNLLYIFYINTSLVARMRDLCLPAGCCQRCSLRINLFPFQIFVFVYIFTQFVKLLYLLLHIQKLQLQILLGLSNLHMDTQYICMSVCVFCFFRIFLHLVIVFIPYTFFNLFTLDFIYKYFQFCCCLFIECSCFYQ